MFKRLTLRNFQKWKKLTIKLDPYVTILTGKNDVGKSAIIRGLGWVTLNKAPSGFRRRGTVSSYVELGVDGHSLRRNAGKGGNQYILDGRKFKVVGRSSPTAVERLVNLTGINFQRQHESSFWFSLTPGQVAKELNKLVDLESIDFIQTKVAKQLRDKKAELAVCEKRLAEARQAVSQLSWVRQFVVVLSRLESSFSEYAATAHRLRRVAMVARLAMRADVRHRAALAGRSIALAAYTAGRESKRAGKRAARLEAIQRAAASAQRAAAIKLPNTKNVERALSKHKRVAAKLDKINSLYQSLVKKQRRLCKCHRKIKETGEKLESLLNGRCPTCGGILTTQTKMY